MRAAWLRRSTPRICNAWRMRWSTVCDEILSSAAISFEDSSWSTNRRQSSCPEERRATRVAIRLGAPGPQSSPGAVRAPFESSKAFPTPPYIAALPSCESTRTLWHLSIIRQFSAESRSLWHQLDPNRDISSANTERADEWSIATAIVTGAENHWWRGLDSNQRTLARADLQSAAFNHSATSPRGSPRAASPGNWRAWRAGAPCDGPLRACQRVAMIAAPVAAGRHAPGMSLARRAPFQAPLLKMERVKGIEPSS
jgi:hypothetical protein